MNYCYIEHTGENIVAKHHVAQNTRITSQPRTGGIYRDEDNQSFLILTMCADRLFVEYANGSTRVISTSEWSQMGATPALC